MKVQEKQKMIKAINDSPLKIYMAITGGGTGFIGDFLKFGGGSQTILGYNVPYSNVALNRFVAVKTNKYCSQETAKSLAQASFHEAIFIAQESDFSYKVDNLLGIGVTASLRKAENEREGRWNGYHICFQTVRGQTVFTVEFTDIEGDRESQEQKMIDCILFDIYNLSQK